MDTWTILAILFSPIDLLAPILAILFSPIELLHHFSYLV